MMEKVDKEKHQANASGGGSASDNLTELKAKSEREPIASFLDMRLLELSQGYAKVSAKLKPEYLNFNNLVFGGIIMAVADQAFAYGTNSVITPNVASQFNIHFVASADTKDELIAECRVVRAGRRVCISEMTVTNQDGKLIAKATGTTIPLV
jgi:acyl-CoA thioesterase